MVKHIASLNVAKIIIWRLPILFRMQIANSAANIPATLIIIGKEFLRSGNTPRINSPGKLMTDGPPMKACCTVMYTARMTVSRLLRARFYSPGAFFLSLSCCFCLLISAFNMVCSMDYSPLIEGLEISNLLSNFAGDLLKIGCN